MRPIFVLISLLLYLPVSGQGVEKNNRHQNHNGQLFQNFGIKAGYNRSAINGKESDGDKTGYIGGELYGGVFAETRLNDRLKLGSEILFSWTDSYHFIEIPVHIQYSLYNRWIVFAGPKFDFLLDAGIVEPASPHKAVGISADIGVQFNFTNKFFAELRYAKGFSKQINDSSFDINDGKRNTARIGLGLRF